MMSLVCNLFVSAVRLPVTTQPYVMCRIQPPPQASPYSRLYPSPSSCVLCMDANASVVGVEESV